MISKKALEKELKRRQKEAKAAPKFLLEKFLFKEQLDFVRDPSKFATAVCSVRAGKTVSCAADLVHTALNQPGTLGLYITLTRTSAKKIIWADLRKIINQYKIKAKFNETELSVKFDNESTVYCFGANDASEIERIRGLSNVALVYIDESQAFRSHIKELVEDIVVKRLYDTNGRCRLIGTPGPIPSGYFYEASHSPKWSHHSWTLHKNIWIQKKSGLTVEQLIQQDCELRGVSIDHPSIQRESFGRWVLDKNSLLLEYSSEKNHYEDLPQGVYNYVLGIDLGFHDSDSLSVLAWSDKSPVTYLIEEVVTSKQDITDLKEQIEKLQRKYTFFKMVADTGGLGKKIVETLRNRHGLPIEAADKTRKIENYAILAQAMRLGNFKAKNTSRFAQDCNVLEKDYEKSTPDKTVVKGHSDAVDSALYPFKESPAYTYSPPKAKFAPGSPEWSYEEQERMRQLAYEQIRKEQEALNDPFLTAFGTETDLNRWKK